MPVIGKSAGYISWLRKHPPFPQAVTQICANHIFRFRSSKTGFRNNGMHELPGHVLQHPDVLRLLLRKTFDSCSPTITKDPAW